MPVAIVMVGEQTRDYKRGLCALGEVIEIADWDTDEIPRGYEDFDVAFVRGVTAEEVRAKLEATAPSLVRAFRISDTNGWRQEKPEKTDAWEDDGQFRKINDQKRPKYAASLAALTTADRASLADEAVGSRETGEIIDKIESTLKLSIDHQEPIDIAMSR